VPEREVVKKANLGYIIEEDEQKKKGSFTQTSAQSKEAGSKREGGENSGLTNGSWRQKPMKQVYLLTGRPGDRKDWPYQTSSRPDEG
jgi:hypothetical protein